MNYRLPLSDEESAARLTMPRNVDGFVVNLFFVPPRERPMLEAQWREWVRGKPKYLQPNWIEDWVRYRQSGSVPQYVGAPR